ncbi:hypothetical protein P389DRAFT_174716 [Cystobasidium minutum MCA 4210]|uniref:uncharacterized protein n=1 Tax=Cystobasidium minutum MCA 4210 TaxID=1397322 RepID=UPI0034CEB990|eukprot:jgi/Rhomi1/174716/fgenesh1_kg.8_\
MADQIKKGDEVSWNWGSGQPSGTVKDVKEEDTEIKSKNNKPIKKKGDEEDPAVVIEQDSGNPVLKKASELNETDV